MTSTIKTGVTTFAMPNDLEVVITRLVDAPRRMVYDAWTNPRHIPNWLAPEGWSMPVCEIEPRPGAAWRYVYRKQDGTEMTLHGVVRELRPPERIVMTESWGPEWPETVNTVVLTESGGRTIIELTIRYPSMEARDAALSTGAKEGLEQGFVKLDRLLETMV